MKDIFGEDDKVDIIVHYLNNIKDTSIRPSEYLKIRYGDITFNSNSIVFLKTDEMIIINFDNVYDIKFRKSR